MARKHINQKEKVFTLKKDKYWPIEMKVGCAFDNCKWGFMFKIKPLFVIYFSTPWFKCWFTVEENARSAYYKGIFQTTLLLRGCRQ